MLISWGCAILFPVVKWLVLLLKITSWEHFSFLIFLKNFHLSLALPIITIIVGTLLLQAKRNGWILALIITLATEIVYFIPSDKTNENVFFKDVMFFYIIAIFLIFAAAFVLLISRPFRLKYHPTNNTWWLLAMCILAIIADKAFMYSIS